MKYVEEKFNKNHLLRAPHQWFFAFLASPIHFLELHYKRTYHLQFRHARKLFLFDMSLIGVVITMFVAWLGWSMYNPTVTDLVYLTISPSKDRILSGEYVTYTVRYLNESEVRLHETKLKIHIPEGFVIDRTDPVHGFSRADTVFDIGVVESGGSGKVSVSGWVYGVPQVEDQVHAQISYQQDGKSYSEEKTSPHITFLRGSLLESVLEIEAVVVEGAEVPFVVKIKNTGIDPLLDISLNLAPFGSVGTIVGVSSTRGTVTPEVWTLSGLLAGESAEIRGTLRVNTHENAEQMIELSPSLTVRDVIIPQTTIQHKVRIAEPRVQVRVAWEDEDMKARPGETVRATIEIHNTGSVSLSGSTIEIPLSRSLVNLAEAARVNMGSVSHNTLVISQKGHASLGLLEPGERRVVGILLPIADVPDGGTNLVLEPTVRVKAPVSHMENRVVEANASLSPLQVGTQVVFSAEVRYYTAEGDQLGRGPLPPEVGKETKYAVLFTIRNTTSNVNKGVLSAKLPSGVTWTGKTSVTHGAVPEYIASTREIRWNIGTIPAHATAGLFAEISVIPREDERGKLLNILESGILNVFDTYLGYTMTRSVGSLDNSLQTDSVGRERGVLVR